MGVNRVTFYMSNGTSIPVEVNDAHLGRVENALRAAEGKIQRLSFDSQRSAGGRFGDTVTVGVNFDHVISWQIERR